MNIDWFTFLAQIVNFLVLVALLRWVLYDRVVSAMNEREEIIAARLEDADQKESEAQQEAERYRDQQSELVSKKEELLEKAREDAQKKKDDLINQAREEVERKRDEWQEAYQQQRDEFLNALRKQAGAAGLEAARHTLEKLANADIESQMYETFIRELEKLDSDQRQKIKAHLEDRQSELQIRSAFEVPPDQQQALKDAIRENFDTDAEITFEYEADLICGLEHNTEGYRMGWNVREFLSEVEIEIDKHLNAKETSS